MFDGHNPINGLVTHQSLDMCLLSFMSQSCHCPVQQLKTVFVNKNIYFHVPCLISANIDPSRRYLYFHIKAGKAFLEHIEDSDPTPGQVSAQFTFHIYFRGQRFKSRPVPCACEPDIDEGFLLELHKDNAGIYCLCLFVIYHLHDSVVEHLRQKRKVRV